MNTKKALFTLTLIYISSYCLLLFNIHGIYWDDWALFNQPNEKVELLFQNAGSIYVGKMHNFLLNSFGPFVYRLITFLIFLASSILLYFTLEKLRIISREIAATITFIFSIAPYNDARITLIVLPYTICFLLFYLGLFKFASYIKNQQSFSLYSSCFFFFLSFYTNSFLLFYLIPVCYLFYSNRQKTGIMTSSYVFLKKYYFLCLLPFLFYLFKTTFLKTSGSYANYNRIQLKRLLEATWTSLSSTIYNITQIFNFNSFDLNVFYTLILFTIFIFLLLRKLKIEDSIEEWKNILILGLCGFALIYIAIFPYCAVRKPPLFHEFESRNQLLIPLGFSLFGTAILQMLKKTIKIKGLYVTSLSLILAFFIIKNNNFYYGYLREWAKVISIITKFKDSAVMENNTTFLVDDLARDLNSNNRFYRYYEWNGYAKSAYNNEKRHFWYLASQKDIANRNFKDMNDLRKKTELNMLNSSEYSWKERPDYVIRIKHGKQSHWWEVLKANINNSSQSMDIIQIEFEKYN